MSQPGSTDPHAPNPYLDQMVWQTALLKQIRNALFLIATVVGVFGGFALLSFFYAVAAT